MFEHNQLPNFEQDVLPHIDAAYNLARWLTRNEQDAQDVTQEAYLRAFRFFHGFRGGDARAWLLKIVRNTFYTWLHGNRPLQDAAEFDENFFPPDSHAPNPEEVVLQNDSDTLVRKALEMLPSNSRESSIGLMLAIQMLSLDPAQPYQCCRRRLARAGVFRGKSASPWARAFRSVNERSGW